MPAAIRIDFCDFWPGFCKTKNFFIDLLSERFEIELSDKPDFIIYADFGHHHRLYTCPRIFFSGETTAPDFRQCDYAFTSHYLDDPRHLRLPLYVLYLDPRELIKAPDEPERILAERRKFCSFIVSNPKNRERIQFFERLNARRKVDSGGRLLNNIGGPVEDKFTFLRSYKLNIAFENYAQRGYTTEKLVQAMQARTIPIYWGNPAIGAEFNHKSFLNFADFPDADAVVEQALKIDENDETYLQYLREPFFDGNKPNEFFSRERLLERFGKIFTAKIQPVGRRRTWFQFGRWTLVKKHAA